MQTIQITAQGGTTFTVAMLNDNGRTFLGSMEYGTIIDGQYVESDDEIIEAARGQFDLDKDIPAVVR